MAVDAAELGRFPRARREASQAESEGLSGHVLHDPHVHALSGSEGITHSREATRRPDCRIFPRHASAYLAKADCYFALSSPQNNRDMVRTAQACYKRFIDLADKTEKGDYRSRYASRRNLCASYCVWRYPQLEGALASIRSTPEKVRFFALDCSSRWNSFSLNHHYWAATKSVSGGGADVGSWTMSFTRGAPYQLGSVSHSK